MIYPLIVYYIITTNYYPSREIKTEEHNTKTIILSASSFVIMIAFIMLISCQFRFGALVVGSSSMKGTIDKGDVIIYDDQGIKDLKIGDVIVFESGPIRIVHRIVNIKSLNNELVYYTKGDNNDAMDEGYVHEADIYGKVITNIPKIGIPTLYLHDVFNRSERGEI